MPSEQAESLAAVLRAVRSNAAVTQPALIRHLGLGRGVVTARIAELEGAGLITQAGVGPSTGGRQPRRLRLRAEAGLIVGVDIGATFLKVGLADLSGRILDRVMEPADVALGPDGVLGRVEELVGTLLARSSGGSVWGVGVGVPGPVEFSTGLPVVPPIMPGWDGYPIRERFARTWNAPTWVDNDVNLMALGELRANPAAAGVRNLLYVKVGTGIGAGLVSGGRLHRGSEGCAGDIGHVTVSESEDVTCRCGNTGCLEALAGGAALAAQGRRLAETDRSDELARVLEQRGRLTAADIASAAELGDVAAKELLVNAGKLIGSTLATLVSFYNPGWVALGGNAISTGDTILTQIRETVRRRSLPLATRRLRIERSSLGTEAGLSGAVNLVADELFEPRCLASWVPHSTPSGRPELASFAGLDVAA
ncbi:ROK family transcriptional regulator [Streptomyces mangrovisoli]|uniref:ROK family transcriptional regulator n=1 Tax=Streptomyces mangrovisoli TaxID=1428628 RepID=UPI000A84B5E4|nr:ROK family transcriptional regulator [Streptomyces mangrovisoli]